MTNYFSAALPSLALALALTLSPVAAAQQPAAGTATRYVQANPSSLRFTFVQVGAASEGRFKQFATELDYDEKNLGASSLKVTVQIASLDTQDSERDAALLAPELFDAQKHPTATYVADSLARNAAGSLEAVGKLTLRGVTRDLRLPLQLKPTATGLQLSGEATIRRLDHGVGQGEWQSTESVGNEVKVHYQVSLVKAK